jgi:DNA-binding NarL/FixJ family response regulator
MPAADRIASEEASVKRREGFSQVRVLLIELPMGRRVLRTALASFEITLIEEWNEVKTDPVDLASLANFDLIIANVDEDDAAAADLLRGLRTGSVPGNPFVPAIITCSSSTAATVRAAVDCGADAVVLKPYSLQQIMDPVEALVDRRRPFVVTADYVGPERRTAQREGQVIEQIIVPNPLAAKVLRLDPASQSAAAEEAWAEIERQKTRRLVFQALFLVRLAGFLTLGTAAPAARRDLARLPTLVRDLAIRLKEPIEYAYLQAFATWASVYPGLTNEDARKSSCNDAAEALGGLLMQLGAAEDPADTITRADEAVFSYCQRLTAA